MGFNKVYRALQEVFPQIDARVLKAVAIEHSKDADAAVEVVLTEIIPFFSERSKTTSAGGASSSHSVLSSSVSSEGSAEVGDSYTVNGGIQLSLLDDEGRSALSTPLPESKTVIESSEASTGGASSSHRAVSSSVSLEGSAEVRDDYTVSAGVQPPVFKSKTVIESFEAPVDTENVAHSSVNTVVSTQAGDDCAINGGAQLSVLDADDGHSDPIYDTHVQDREEVFHNAELTLSENSHETIIEQTTEVDSNREAAKASSDKEDENIVQNDESSDLNTGTVSVGKCPESNIGTSSVNISSQKLGILQDFHSAVDETANLIQEYGISDGEVNGHERDGETENLVREYGTTANEVNGHEKSLVDGDNSIAVPASLAVDNHAIRGESGLQLVELPDAPEGNMGKLDSSLSNGSNSLMENSGSNIGTEDATLNSSMSNSNQMYMLDVLEEVIADARSNKKTMLSTMQSVISLAKEVELKEQAAEQAKVEADMGGTDTLVKVEVLKEIIHHAKGANSMHAGEVYGEKSILTSELRELQSRVLSLSDERDNSLAVLHEMRNGLEVRLAEAENEIKSAEQRKVEKEMVANAALAEQEMIMDEVVRESKILKQQAEDNAKLQEFLMDRGRVVDKLQGEIAVICQDVRLLKEKFDERIPFSKSLSSSHASFILASSSHSSVNSLVPKQVESMFEETQDSLKPQTEEDPVVAFINKESSEEKVARDNRDSLSEDDWELLVEPMNRSP